MLERFRDTIDLERYKMIWGDYADMSTTVFAGSDSRKFRNGYWRYTADLIRLRRQASVAYVGQQEFIAAYYRPMDTPASPDSRLIPNLILAAGDEGSANQ